MKTQTNTTIADENVHQTLEQGIPAFEETDQAEIGVTKNRNELQPTAPAEAEVTGQPKPPAQEKPSATGEPAACEELVVKNSQSNPVTTEVNSGANESHQAASPVGQPEPKNEEPSADAEEKAKKEAAGAVVAAETTNNNDRTDGTNENKAKTQATNNNPPANANENNATPKPGIADETSSSSQEGTASAGSEKSGETSSNPNSLFQADMDQLNAEREELTRQKAALGAGRLVLELNEGMQLQLDLGPISEAAIQSLVAKEREGLDFTHSDEIVALLSEDKTLAQRLRRNRLVHLLQRAFKRENDLIEELSEAGKIKNPAQLAPLAKVFTNNRRLDVKLRRRHQLLGLVFGSPVLLVIGVVLVWLALGLIRAGTTTPQTGPGRLTPTTDQNQPSTGNSPGAKVTGTSSVLTHRSPTLSTKGPANKGTPMSGQLASTTKPIGSGSGSKNTETTTGPGPEPGRSNTPAPTLTVNPTGPSGTGQLGQEQGRPIQVGLQVQRATLAELVEPTPTNTEQPPATPNQDLTGQATPTGAGVETEEVNSSAHSAVSSPHGSLLPPARLTIGALGINLPIHRALSQELVQPDGTVQLSVNGPTPGSGELVHVATSAYPGEIGNMILLGSEESLASLRWLEQNHELSFTDSQGNTFIYAALPLSASGQVERVVNPATDGWIVAPDTEGAALVTILMPLPQAGPPVAGTGTDLPANPNSSGSANQTTRPSARDDYTSPYRLAYRAVLVRRLFTKNASVPAGTPVAVPSAVWQTRPAYPGGVGVGEVGAGAAISLTTTPATPFFPTSASANTGGITTTPAMPATTPNLTPSATTPPNSPNNSGGTGSSENSGAKQTSFPIPPGGLPATGEGGTSQKRQSQAMPTPAVDRRTTPEPEPGPTPQNTRAEKEVYPTRAGGGPNQARPQSY